MAPFKGSPLLQRRSIRHLVIRVNLKKPSSSWNMIEMPTDENLPSSHSDTQNASSAHTTSLLETSAVRTVHHRQQPKRVKIHSGPLLPLKKRKQDTSVPTITAHSVDDNHSAAEYFKSLLTFDSTEIEEKFKLQGPLVDPHTTQQTQASAVTPPESFEETSPLALPSSEWMANRMLRHAFEREYTGRQGWRRGMMEGGWRDQTELWEQTNNHILPEDPLVESVQIMGPHAIGSRISVNDNQNTGHPPPFVDIISKQNAGVSIGMVAGMVNGIPRNSHDHLIHSGQAVGAGVIGADQSLRNNEHYKVTQTEMGCDIPMRQLHHVTLDPTLPPLALEHPARVWNSTIHALPASLQPIIKWDYEKQRDVYGDIAHVAHLTLILPPSHPAVTGHKLFSILPKNRYSREYIKSAFALGGVKRWTGNLTLLRVDAQNSALVNCIQDGGIEWIRQPPMRPLPELEADDDDCDSAQYPVAQQRDCEIVDVQKQA